jgi:hypothetical protein
MDAGIRTITKTVLFCSLRSLCMSKKMCTSHKTTHQICRACAFTNHFHVGPGNLEEKMELESFPTTDNAITKVCVGGETQQCQSGHEVVERRCKRHRFACDTKNERSINGPRGHFSRYTARILQKYLIVSARCGADCYGHILGFGSDRCPRCDTSRPSHTHFRNSVFCTPFRVSTGASVFLGGVHGCAACGVGRVGWQSARSTEMRR